MTTYVRVTTLVEPGQITQLQPLWDDFEVLGAEYQCRVQFRETDRTWAEWMTVTAEELAPALFPTRERVEAAS